ncbi:MAG TPA: prepilin-type N-terminal cleavage/methylation domain-containing protein [Gemmatimonadaceae bacterium]|jgi:prepilin-type N-terminal cleavage/methylation domain-containing protein|nr:prepilin-type N-terminal cleavage/methylation domain-containing protein [Gemmatimonadaceae bacterium]
MARRRGFSLFELTAVLMLIAMLFAIAAPRFAAMRDGAAVHAALGDIGGTFDLARQSAVANRASTAVVIDTAAGELVVRWSSSGGGTIARRTIQRLYGVTLGANRDSVVYDSRGLGYGVSNVTVIARRGAFVDTLTMSRLGRLRY